MASPLVFPWLHVCVQQPEERLFSESDLMMVRLGSIVLMLRGRVPLEGRTNSTLRPSSSPPSRGRCQDKLHLFGSWPGVADWD